MRVVEWRFRPFGTLWTVGLTVAAFVLYGWGAAALVALATLRVEVSR